MIYNNIISFCGNNCSSCPRYKATQANDNERLEQLAELWFRVGFRDKIVSANEMRCNGCTVETNCSYKINNCKHRGNNNNCGECDFFPCDKISIAFEKANVYKMSCKLKCTDNELFILEKSFFSKEQILSDIYKSYYKEEYK